MPLAIRAGRGQGAVILPFRRAEMVGSEGGRKEATICWHPSSRKGNFMQAGKTSVSAAWNP
jgi:hypothetical protein